MLGRQKVFRDFWQERTRTTLVVLAISLGIAAFFAVLGAYAILTRELNQGYMATNPASAVLRIDNVDDALVASVQADPAVKAAEARRVVSGRIKAGPAVWRNLVLFVVKDFRDIQVSKLLPDKGAWPPATGEILIERNAVEVARAHIGEKALVRLSGDAEQTLLVSGIVHDVGQAQARMENLVYGYITVDTLTQLGEEPFFDRLNILVAQKPLDEQHIRDVATSVKKLAESKGYSVRSIDIPKPGKHPHADIMGLLLLAMSAFGFAVLLLSSILVINLLTGLMASQIGQIGVMKAIGGTQWQIARIYFSQALLLGAAAIVVALPVGIFGSRLLCRYLAGFLNFDITSFASPAWVYLLVAAVGLVVPLLAAAHPIWKGSGIPVREALADSGVSPESFGTNTFDRMLAGMGGVFRPLLLAIRNSFRRRARLALTVATLAAGGLFFMSALNIRASMINTLDRLFAAKKFDLSVGLGTMYPFEKVERAVKDTPGIVQAEGWIVMDGGLPGAGDAPAGGHGAGVSSGDHFTVIAMPAQTKLLTPEIAEGRGLLPTDTNAIVLNTALAAKGPQMKVGNTVALRMGPARLNWQIVGIAREPFSPATAYIASEYLKEVGGHQGMANSVRIVLKNTDVGSIESVKAGLDRNLEREGIRAMASTSKAESRFGFDQHMLMIYVFLIVVSCILAGVGGLGLMTTMSLNVLERRREMGVLRAIGATPPVVCLIVVAESVAIGVLSWVLAGLLAWPVSKALGSLLVTVMFKSTLDFYFEPSGLFIWLGVSLFLGILGGFVPAWQASRLTVREALAHG